VASPDERDLAGRILRAQEDERRRVARELHDDVTQRLAALALDCATLEGTLGRRSAAREGLRRVQEEAARLSQDVQALSRELHPSIVEDLGLAAAADALCTRVAQREKTAIRLLQTGADDGLPRDVAVCLYRVLQEGPPRSRSPSTSANETPRSVSRTTGWVSRPGRRPGAWGSAA
jgi:signal transduction histidine kinase